MNSLPFSQACENNKQFILEVIEGHLQAGDRVLEIGSGTGQHGVHFATAMPNIYWQCSDMEDNLPTLQPRIRAARLGNLPEPIPLNVDDPEWSREPGDLQHAFAGYDVVFSANSLHIMGEGSVQNFFQGTLASASPNRILMVYGPFKYGGEFTTESNANFDLWLKGRNPVSGIRDFEWVNQLARSVGFQLLEDIDMPANNQLLVWCR